MNKIISTEIDRSNKGQSIAIQTSTRLDDENVRQWFKNNN